MMDLLKCNAIISQGASVLTETLGGEEAALIKDCSLEESTLPMSLSLHFQLVRTELMMPKY